MSKAFRQHRKGLTAEIWATEHGWAMAVYEGDGSMPGNLIRGGGAYSTPDAAWKVALEVLAPPTPPSQEQR